MRITKSKAVESINYFENAKELLLKSPIEENIYTEVKYVRQACGTAYIAILKVIDEYLINKGVDVKKLPQSVDGYREAIRKYLSVHDGKLAREFEVLYNTLHIAGYYRGLFQNVDVVKEAFKSAKTFIDKIRSYNKR